MMVYRWAWTGVMELHIPCQLVGGPSSSGSGVLKSESKGYTMPKEGQSWHARTTLGI